jgi:membrane protein
MNKLRHFFAFLRYVAETFYDDRCLRSSAALTYTTLLSLVPLSTVIFSVFAAFPMFKSFAGDIQNFVFHNFVPASGEVIQQHLEQFAAKTSQLTALGFTFLILSALLMMNTIEGAMNDIWHIASTRRPVPKFMVYWAMLTLGPILVGVSLAVTSYFTSLPLFNETALIAGIKAKLLVVLPFLSTTLACTLLYAIVPNTYVPLRHAFTGAVVAAALFELAKKGFALYVTTFPTYEMIYGALAIIPVFLVWLYLSWMVVMLGAEISYCLYHHQPERVTEDNSSGGERLLTDFHVVGRLWQAQLEGALPDEDTLRLQDPHLDKTDLESALIRLSESGLIHQTMEGHWALSRDASTLTLGDLFRAQENMVPELKPEWIGDDPLSQELEKALAHTNQLIDTALTLRLQPLFQAALNKAQAHAGDEDVTPSSSEKQRIEPTIKL